MSLRILATGASLPQRVVTNDELAQLVDTNDNWIKTRTGIESRHVATKETLTDLTEAAAREAMEKAGILPGDIDLVMCSTISGDYVTPSQACMTAERLGLTCPAFDLNGACAGFIYCLDVAEAYIKTGKAKTILILTAEMMSKHVDWTDRNTCVLFGDGGGAALVTQGNALKYINILAEPKTEHLCLPGRTGNSPFYEHQVTESSLYMDGQEVFKFAVGMIERESRKAVAELGMTLDDIDYYILHQANKRIIQTAQSRLKEPESKFPTSIQDTGNMSSVTIPVLLNRLLGQGKIKKGDTLFMSAFGAGMTAGSCVMVWE